MLATKIVCPHCQKALKSTTPLAVGKRVLCKQCGNTFAVQSPDVSTHTPFPARNGIVMPGPVPSAAAPGVEPIATAFDGGRLVKIALVGLVLAGGLLVIGGGSVAALVYAARKEHTPGVVGNDDKFGSDKPNKNQVGDPPSTPPNDQRPIRPGLNDPDEKQPVSTPRLPPEEQEKVNKAIENGLAYLKKLATDLGNHQHGVGLVALQGLTLLECGVPADDALVQSAAQFVRGRIPNLNMTYDTSLAILFLDRLGLDSDQGNITTLALRLVASQKGNGGWYYDCDPLSPQDERDLLAILKESRPSNPLELFAGPDGKVKPEYFTPGEKLPEFVVPKGIGEPDQPKGSGQGSTLPSGNEKDIKELLKQASPKIKAIPSLKDRASDHGFDGTGNSDNSNTQFAILAVWVAGRHEVPMERTLAMIVKRFRTSQDKGGRWGYAYQRSPAYASGEAAMTCAGLLGLGAGYGLTAVSPEKAAKQGGVQDKAVMDGFKALSQTVGKPMGNSPNKRVRRPVNLYFLWSVERVGVMYNVTNIGDKDWYQWGAELIVDHQNADGGWSNGGYPGANPAETPRVDTCFALLFLKRANLAKDLSKKLEYLIDVKDLGNK